MKWLTDNSRLEKLNEANEWTLVDNELFQDEDGAIYLVPKNYKTDNYTIPNWIAWLGGCKSTYDPRPSHIHDFGCQYHEIIRVNLTEAKLRQLRYLYVEGSRIVCKDIPRKYLELVKVTKWQIDCLFKRAMKATGTIPARIYNLYRSGVFFNIGWLGNHPEYDLNNIYKEVE